MIAALLEYLILVVWELSLAYVFYSTGALLLHLISLGKLQPPLSMPKIFNEQKDQIEYLKLCYLLGVVFYLLLILLTIGTVKL